MGFIAHRAVIVTTFEAEYAEAILQRAGVVFGHGRAALLSSPLNHYLTIFIAPDGSKEGWPDSEADDVRRAKFIKWLKENELHESLYADWAVVRYGGDAPDETCVEAFNDETGAEDA